MKIMKNIILFILILLFLSLWGFYWALYPIRITSSTTPRDYGVRYEDVSFLTDDNILIRGWFIPNKNPQAKTIIVLHGYPADKGNVLPAMIFLHKRFNLLFIDFRYLGKSEGPYSTAGKNEVLDLKAAIHYLRNRNIHEVGVWGFSMGGAVALMGAPQLSEIKAIVTEFSYARLDWMAQEYYRIPLVNYLLAELSRVWGWVFLGVDIKHVSPAESVRQLKIPILLIHSKQDNVVDFRHALLLQKNLINNPNVEIIFDEKNLHGEPIPSHEKVIEQFFEENLEGKLPDMTT